MKSHGWVGIALAVSAVAAAGDASWTWVATPNRGPLANSLNGVAVLSGTAYAVGHYYEVDLAAYRTLVQRWDGSGWRMMTVPNVGSGYNDLYAVSGTSDHDVWAVGSWRSDGYSPYQPLMLHWDGARWRTVSTNLTGAALLTGVAAVAPNDVWAVGAYQRGPLAIHWNGTSWQTVATPTSSPRAAQFSAVSAAASNDVWAVGYAYVGGRYVNLTEHWDGAQWRLVASPTVGTKSNYLRAVTTVRPNLAWAVGQIQGVGSQILRWNGSQWIAAAHSNNGTLWGVCASGPSQAWAVGYVNEPGGVRTAVHRWDGSRWTVADAPNPNQSSDLFAVAAAGSTAWTVGLTHLENDRTLALRTFY